MHARASTATWSGSATARWSDTAHDAAIGMAAAIAPALPPTVEPPGRLGVYRLLAVLGEGGMARVYLGEHTLIERRVAIKRLLPALACDPQAQARFLREAQIAGSIRHPNLCDIYDFGVDGAGRPYFVMEVAAGETLAARVSRGRLLMSQCLDVAIQLSDAIGAIHKAGYVHRDIKSENVVLVDDDRRTVPKLIDFGIARPIAAGPLTAFEGVVGTPRTMAPEQIAQDVIDERTDIWGIGVLLHEMLTGELPFRSCGSCRADMLAIVTDAPRPLPPGTDEGVRAIIAACLSKDPDGRPASAAILGGLLRAAQSAYLARLGLIERALTE